MTPAALIRAQQLRTPFRKLGQRRARWLEWRKIEWAGTIGESRKRKARRMLRWMSAEDFAWTVMGELI